MAGFRRGRLLTSGTEVTAGSRQRARGFKLTHLTRVPPQGEAWSLQDAS